MDAAEQLVFQSEISVVVLGKGKDFFLVRLDQDNSLTGVTSLARLNEYTYCGCIGITEGEPKVVAEPDPESRLTMIHAALALAGVLAESMKHKALSGDWCERLYSLQDLRT